MTDLIIILKTASLREIEEVVKKNFDGPKFFQIFISVKLRDFAATNDLAGSAAKRPIRLQENKARNKHKESRVETCPSAVVLCLSVSQRFICGPGNRPSFLAHALRRKAPWPYRHFGRLKRSSAWECLFHKVRQRHQNFIINFDDALAASDLTQFIFSVKIKVSNCWFPACPERIDSVTSAIVTLYSRDFKIYIQMMTSNILLSP
jgi:hypothetical protein